MRFLSRLRSKDDESTTEVGTTHKYSGLGIFSPAVDAVEPNPTRELRRLAELEAIFVRSKRLESLEDVPYVVNQIRDGNIVLLDISRLNDGKEQTHLELKRIIERIRGETRSYQADIALVNDSCIIVAPSFVRL
ncbi:MAG: cell division protein SepF [Promethearchaeota archaeon]